MIGLRECESTKQSAIDFRRLNHNKDEVLQRLSTGNNIVHMHKTQDGTYNLRI